MSSTRYVSTRGGIEPIGFQDAVMMGLATDGGLLLPEDIPNQLPLAKYQKMAYLELAAAIFRLFIDDETADAELHRLLDLSYQTFRHPEITPSVEVGPLYVLELFHGPTLAFKDVALQLLGNLFDYLLQRRGGQLNLLGATSGDTGSAAIYGVRGKRNIRIFVMHPRGRVSTIQEKQMTTVLDDNVFNLAIEGSFDDGQRILKEIFSDNRFKEEYQLGAVNSVNWARVMAQIVYYFYTAFRIQEKTGCQKVQFSVPTGNFGDIFAGYLAWKMGAPIHRLILATNENDILTRFFNTGLYAMDSVKHTLSPSMDIQVASNFERYLYYRLARDSAATTRLMREFAQTGRLSLPGQDPVFAAASAGTEQTLATIHRYHRDYGYLLDPHTAVGVAVAEKFQDPAIPMVCLATAHPAKFPQAISQAISQNLARHPLIDEILHLPTRCETIAADPGKIKDYVRSACQGK